MEFDNLTVLWIQLDTHKAMSVNQGYYDLRPMQLRNHNNHSLAQAKHKL